MTMAFPHIRIVMRGLDPRIHHLRKELSEDGWPGQARP
jgi:hypothetical protein